MTVTATVTGAPAGTVVTFTYGAGTPLGTAVVGPNGVATLTTDAVTFPGTAQFSAATAATATTAASSGNSAVVAIFRRVGESDTGEFAVVGRDDRHRHRVLPATRRRSRTRSTRSGPGAPVRAVVADVTGDGTSRT